MSLQPPLAHLGHWYLWAPYMVPVLVVLAAVGRAVWSERREQRREAAGNGNGRPEEPGHQARWRRDPQRRRTHVMDQWPRLSWWRPGRRANHPDAGPGPRARAETGGREIGGAAGRATAGHLAAADRPVETRMRRRYCARTARPQAGAYITAVAVREAEEASWPIRGRRIASDSRVGCFGASRVLVFPHRKQRNFICTFAHSEHQERSGAGY